MLNESVADHYKDLNAAEIASTNPIEFFKYLMGRLVKEAKVPKEAVQRFFSNELSSLGYQKGKNFIFTRGSKDLAIEWDMTPSTNSNNYKDSGLEFKFIGVLLRIKYKLDEYTGRKNSEFEYNIAKLTLKQLTDKIIIRINTFYNEPKISWDDYKEKGEIASYPGNAKKIREFENIISDATERLKEEATKMGVGFSGRSSTYEIKLSSPDRDFEGLHKMLEDAAGENGEHYSLQRFVDQQDIKDKLKKLGYFYGVFPPSFKLDLAWVIMKKFYVKLKNLGSFVLRFEIETKSDRINIQILDPEDIRRYTKDIKSHEVTLDQIHQNILEEKKKLEELEIKNDGKIANKEDYKQAVLRATIASIMSVKKKE